MLEIELHEDFTRPAAPPTWQRFAEDLESRGSKCHLQLAEGSPGTSDEDSSKGLEVVVALTISKVIGPAVIAAVTGYLMARSRRRVVLRCSNREIEVRGATKSEAEALISEFIAGNCH